MSEVMIVMMVVMLATVFGFGHHRTMDGHGSAPHTERMTACDPGRQVNCPQQAVAPKIDGDAGAASPEEHVE